MTREGMLAGARAPVATTAGLAAATILGLVGPALSQTAKAPDQVTFYGNPRSPISSGVVIPANRAYVWTSGTVPGVADENAAAGTRARYGDTYTQAASVLSRISGQLAEQGLTMKDVVYVRAYLVPDPEKEGKIDMEGWSKAFGEVFGTEENPTKPARSTVGVAALVVADWLIEIEAFAVFPE
ncbi:MAG TPA: RidA family protein [Thermoanaerobaculia bacterium]|nr:RidA family protein [Thermoanaerobaculia bacterium]